MQSSADGWKLGAAAGVRQESEVPDAAEPFWQDVEQEATDELISIERHHLGLAVRAIILPTEADATVLAVEEPTIGDRDAMGVAPQIFQHLLWPTEGTLGIDVPFDMAQRLEMLDEDCRLYEACEIAKEHELSFVERRLQALQEQTPIESRQNTDWEKEVGPAADPASVGREAMAAFVADPFLKFVVVVDHDVDITSDTDVLHAIATRVRADHDVFMVPYAKGSPLDPASYDPAAGSNLVTKMGIDATRKSNYPDEIAVPGSDKINMADYIPNYGKTGPAGR